MVIKSSRSESHKNIVFATFHDFITESRQLNLTRSISTRPWPIHFPLGLTSGLGQLSALQPGP